jgi:hypothetical protein
MAAGPHYIALARTTKKTPLQKVLLALGDVTIRDHNENTVPLLLVQSL